MATAAICALKSFVQRSLSIHVPVPLRLDLRCGSQAVLSRGTSNVVTPGTVYSRDFIS